MASILITGGTGFAGSHLVEVLLASYSKDEIHVTNTTAHVGPVSELLSSNNIHQIDLTDATATLELFQRLQPTQVYHLAAYAAVGNSFDQAQKVLDINTRLQLSVLEAVRAGAPQARVLIIGSGMEYDVFQEDASQPIKENHPLGPVSPYAVSKATQDLLGLSYYYSYKLQIVRARPFNHIGERQTPDFAVPSFAQQIVAVERGQQSELKVGNLEAVRDFTDVKDMVKAYQVLMEQGEVGQVYNIGSGHGYKMADVLNWMCELAQVPVTITTDPSKMRPSDVPNLVADTSRITALGWKPQIELKATLERVLADWRQQPLS